MACSDGLHIQYNNSHGWSRQPILSYPARSASAYKFADYYLAQYERIQLFDLASIRFINVKI